MGDIAQRTARPASAFVQQILKFADASAICVKYCEQPSLTTDILFSGHGLVTSLSLGQCLA